MKAGSPIQSLTLNYPLSTARFLRIKIADDGSGDLRMRGATGHFDSSVAPTLVESQILPVAQVEDTVIKTSTTDFDRGRSGTVFHQVTLETSSINFNRNVILQLSNDRERWKSAGRSEIYSYTLGNNPLKGLTISLPESTERYVRVVVFNQGNPSIKVTGAVFSGFAKRLVFLAVVKGVLPLLRQTGKQFADLRHRTGPGQYQHTRSAESGRRAAYGQS